MGISLCVDDNIDALVEIIMDDAGLESETDAHDVVNHLAMQLGLLRVEMSSTTSVETTDDDVIITVKIPRSQ